MGQAAPTIAQAILDHLLQGDMQMASALVTQHAPANLENAEFLYIAARVAREARNLDMAKQIMARLLTLAHDDSNVHELAYKISYDDIDLTAAQSHMAAGARTEPPNVYLKQLALQQVVRSGVQDEWLGRLCKELLLAIKEPDEHMRTATILADTGLYDLALAFLQRGAAITNTSHDYADSRQAFLNDIHVLQQLRAGKPVSFPPCILDGWEQMQRLMAPVEATSPGGPKATVIVTSHFSNKLVFNAAKAPPNTLMLQETLASFRTHAKLPADWPIIICFDAPATPQPEAEAAYLSALQDVCAEANATVRTYRAMGLRQVFLDVFKDITTPYFMLLEHDWVCARELEPLPALAALMDSNPHLHHIRYPRHHSHINASDWYLMGERFGSDMAVMHTPYFSNNPALTRTAKFTRDWLPLITANQQFDTVNAGAGGIEEAINATTWEHMRRWGVYATRAAQGCAIVGQVNDPPRIVHTGI